MSTHRHLFTARHFPCNLSLINQKLWRVKDVSVQPTKPTEIAAINLSEFLLPFLGGETKLK